MESLAHEHEPKDDKLAWSYRNEAVALLKQEKFYESLELFNKALCYAPDSSKSMIYGDRSDAFFQLQEYDLCQDDIDLSNEFLWGRGQRARTARLSLRSQTVKRLRDKPRDKPEDDPWDFFKISLPKNEKYPSMANCLELKEDETFGRHIITNKDLKPGDVIIVEESPFKALTEAGIYSRCANCFKSNKMNLMPQDDCANAMYCSVTCLNYGKGKYMCAYDEPFGIVPRILFQALDILNSRGSEEGKPRNALDTERLQAFMDDAELRNKTILDFDMSNPSPADYLYYHLVALNSMMTNRDAEKYSEIIENHPILANWTKESDLVTVKAFMTHLTNLVNNGLGLDWWVLKKNEDGTLSPKSSTSREVKLIGNGIFPISCFFSHSCCPNTERFGVGNKFVVIVRLPIKKGEQVFISYGPTFDSTHRRARRHNISGRFNFNCVCDACKNDWPQSPKMKKTDKKFQPPGEVIQSIKAAKKEFTENCAYISKNFKSFPNFEISRLLTRNFYLLSAISKNEPCMF